MLALCRDGLGVAGGGPRRLDVELLGGVAHPGDDIGEGGPARLSRGPGRQHGAGVLVPVVLAEQAGPAGVVHREGVRVPDLGRPLTAVAADGRLGVGRLYQKGVTAPEDQRPHALGRKRRPTLDQVDCLQTLHRAEAELVAREDHGDDGVGAAAEHGRHHLGVTDHVGQAHGRLEPAEKVSRPGRCCSGRDDLTGHDVEGHDASLCALGEDA